jgi:hypothetical protein
MTTLNNKDTANNETFGLKSDKNGSRQVHIIVKEQLWISIKNEARKKGQTVSAEIRQLLYDHYQERSSGDKV